MSAATPQGSNEIAVGATHGAQGRHRSEPERLAYLIPNVSLVASHVVLFQRGPQFILEALISCGGPLVPVYTARILFAGPRAHVAWLRCECVRPAAPMRPFQGRVCVSLLAFRGLHPRLFHHTPSGWGGNALRLHPRLFYYTLRVVAFRVQSLGALRQQAADARGGGDQSVPNLEVSRRFL